MVAKKPAVLAFRVDHWFGQELGKLAAASDISMGEVAKRLSYASLHGFDVSYYLPLCELAALLPEMGFGQACQVARAHLTEPKEKSKVACRLPDRETSLLLLEQLVKTYRYMRGLEEKTETRTVQIRIIRGP